MNCNTCRYWKGDRGLVVSVTKWKLVPNKDEIKRQRRILLRRLGRGWASGHTVRKDGSFYVWCKREGIRVIAEFPETTPVFQAKIKVYKGWISAKSVKSPKEAIRNLLAKLDLLGDHLMVAMRELTEILGEWR